MSQTPFNIQRAAVIGAGTMGRGIVMCLANAGVPVQWVDNNPQMLEQALSTVADTYAHNVRQGRPAIRRRWTSTPSPRLHAVRPRSWACISSARHIS